MTIEDNAPGSPRTVALDGIGKKGPELTVSPAALEFGDQVVGRSVEREVAAANTGDLPLTLQSIQISGTSAASFSITQGGGSGTLAPGESRTIRILFAPTATGPRFPSGVPPGPGDAPHKGAPRYDTGVCAGRRENGREDGRAPRPVLLSCACAACGPTHWTVARDA